MRILVIAVCACILGALAAEAQPDSGACHKGIFWPFSRAKGDCLTDAEKKNGLTGNYQDPTGSVRPAAAAAASIPAPTAPTVPNAPVAPVARSKAEAGPCTKGLLWPFSREKGDCLTDTEKKNGLTGNYQDPAASARAPAGSVAPIAPAPRADSAPPASGGSFFGLFGSGSGGGSSDRGLLVDNPALAGSTATVVNTPNASPAPVANIETRPVANGPASPAVVADREAAIAGPGANVPCNKGILWPFSREKGDCLTDYERKNGRTGNYKDPHPAIMSRVSAAAPNASVAAAGEARPVSADGAIPPANDSAACRKGIFWPFVREPGDCPTDAEKKRNGTH